MEAGPPQGLHKSGHAPPSAQTLLTLFGAGVSKTGPGLTPLVGSHRRIPRLHESWFHAGSGTLSFPLLDPNGPMSSALFYTTVFNWLEKKAGPTELGRTMTYILFAAVTPTFIL